MSNLILTDNAEWIIPAGDIVEVKGTNDVNTVGVSLGASVEFDGTFNQGLDNVYIEADSSDFQVSLSGAEVTLTYTDDSTIKIRVGPTGQDLTFGNGVLNLKVDTTAGQVVMLGDQVLVSGEAPAAITALVDDTVTSQDIFQGGGETINTAPVANDDAELAAIVNAPIDLDVLGNDEDADLDVFNFDADDGDAITVTAPEGATATAVYDLTNGDIDFTADTAGTYSFEYAIKDNHGGTDTATATVTVSEEADTTAPVVAADQAATYDENAAAGDVLYTVTAMDNEGGTGVASFAFAEGSNADGYFAIDASTGAISLTETGAAADINNFEAGAAASVVGVIATDNAGNVSDAADVTLTVADINDAPVAADDTNLQAVKDTATNLDVLANDDDADAADTVVFDTTDAIVVTGPEGATATAVYDEVNNDIDFTADTAGEYTFTYAVTDGKATDTATATVTVSEEAVITDEIDGFSAASHDAQDGVVELFTFDYSAGSSNVTINNFNADEDFILLDSDGANMDAEAFIDANILGEVGTYYQGTDTLITFPSLNQITLAGVQNNDDATLAAAETAGWIDFA